MAPGILTAMVPGHGTPETGLIRSERLAGHRLLGNWNGDATGTKIGVYKDGTWYLDYNGNGVWDAGIDKVDYFGTLGWTSVVGKWN